MYLLFYSSTIHLTVQCLSFFYKTYFCNSHLKRTDGRTKEDRKNDKEVNNFLFFIVKVYLLCSPFLISLWCVEHIPQLLLSFEENIQKGRKKFSEMYDWRYYVSVEEMLLAAFLFKIHGSFHISLAFGSERIFRFYFENFCCRLVSCDLHFYFYFHILCVFLLSVKWDNKKNLHFNILPFDCMTSHLSTFQFYETIKIKIFHFTPTIFPHKNSKFDDETV